MGKRDTGAPVQVLDPGMSELSSMFRSFGLPDPTDMLAALAGDPDAPTIESVCERLDGIDAALDDFAERLEVIRQGIASLQPLLALAAAVNANSGKLARFGIKVD